MTRSEHTGSLAVIALMWLPIVVAVPALIFLPGLWGAAAAFAAFGGGLVAQARQLGVAGRLATAMRAVAVACALVAAGLAVGELLR